jgi:hypothetical protein
MLISHRNLQKFHQLHKQGKLEGFIDSRDKEKRILKYLSDNLRSQNAESMLKRILTQLQKVLDTLDESKPQDTRLKQAIRNSLEDIQYSEPLRGPSYQSIRETIRDMLKLIKGDKPVPAPSQPEEHKEKNLKLSQQFQTMVAPSQPSKQVVVLQSP